MAMTDTSQQLCQQVAAALLQRRLLLSTAESCTGGGVACALTALSGSSAWFDSGFVTYSNSAKVAMLGVQPSTLEAHGAVSEPTAAEMARGAIAHGRSQMSCAITGIAGPSGGTADKPVGTVCFGWAHADGLVITRTERLFGDRAAVREQSQRVALQGVLALLDRLEAPQ